MNLLVQRFKHLRLLLFGCCCCCLWAGHSLANSLHNDDRGTIRVTTTTTTWVEEVPSPSSTTNIESSPNSIGQQPTMTKQQQKKQEPPPPHPLRTDEWRISLHWKKKNKKNRSGVFAASYPETLHLDFDPSGFVRSRMDNIINDDPSTGSNHDEETTTTSAVSKSSPSFGNKNNHVGRWELTPTGLTWNFEIMDDHCDNRDEATTKKYVFHADLHINPFGVHPRLSHGLVLLHQHRTNNNHNKWFRPVVATFSGQGIGVDSVDLSYRSRESFTSPTGSRVR